jgi:hypothetical protein
MNSNNFLKKFGKLSKEVILQFESIVVEIEAEKLHNIWSHWMGYIFEVGNLDSDGNIVLNKDLVDRWKIQKETKYDDLTEEEKESDRNIVKKFMLGFKKEENDVKK